MGYLKFETVIEKPIEGMPALDGLVGKRVEIIVLEQPAPSVEPLTPKRGGWAKGKIRISDDFDAPLDDFKEYM